MAEVKNNTSFPHCSHDSPQGMRNDERANGGESKRAKESDQKLQRNIQTNRQMKE